MKYITQVLLQNPITRLVQNNGEERKILVYLEGQNSLDGLFYPCIGAQLVLNSFYAEHSYADAVDATSKS